MSFTEDRLAALEQRLEELSQPLDTLTPTYLTVNPDGTIGATFSGHVKASAFDLTLTSTAKPTGPAPNLLDWLIASGAIAAFVEAYASGNAAAFYNLIAGVQATDASGRFAQLHAQVNGTGAGLIASTIWAETLNHTLKLLDDTGASDLLQAANNLADLTNAATARTNLGLGTAATAALTSLLQAANNLSDLTSAATARTNLGLGTAATAALTSLLQAANNLSELTNKASGRANLGIAGGSSSVTPPNLNATAAFAVTNNSLYYHQVLIPNDATLTGILFNGSNGGHGGNVIVALYDANGNRVAISNSTVVSATASTQLIPFTGAYAAAPGIYYAAVIYSAGASIASGALGWRAGSAVQGTFAAPATITPAAQPTSSTIPALCTY